MSLVLRSQPLRALSRSGVIVLMVFVLAGCGGASGKLVAAPCVTGHGPVTVQLLLRDPGVTTKPVSQETVVSQGTVVEVINHIAGYDMSYPLAIPATAVCEVSQRYGSDGPATVIYQLRRTGRIIFSGSQRDLEGNAAAFAMEGQLIVHLR